MSAPGPDDMSLLAKVLAAGAAVLTPPFLAWKWLQGCFDKKADKHAVANTFQEVRGELAVQRQNIGKLFDKLDENEKRSSDRHLELMREIGRKADR